MTDYAVGDIQGCLTPLLKLLAKVDFSPSRDCLWVAGDLVNRGPDSLDTLRFLQRLDGSTNIVLGNHDLHLLAIANTERQPNRHDTLDAVLQAQDWPTLEQWLRHQPLLHFDRQKNIAMAHAGIPPVWDIEQALTRADEVHQRLIGNSYSDFFQNMYGNAPSLWQPDITGNDRLRLITNYFTRMRFCDNHSQLDLVDKSHKVSQRCGYKPWFEYHQLQQKNAPEIIFGHWAALEGETNNPRYHALDTGCVWGGKLTIMQLNNRQKTTQKL